MLQQINKFSRVFHGVIGVSPRLRKAIVSLAGTVVMLAERTLAWAQGCPLCYNAAAATKAGGIAALRNGVLILMIPPVLIVGLVCIMGIRRYRNDSAAEPDFAAPASEDFELDEPLQGAGVLPELPRGTR
jgi:hypothetical protein